MALDVTLNFTITYPELHFDDNIVDECFERELLLLLECQRISDTERCRITADVDAVGIDGLFLFATGLLTLLQSLLPIICQMRVSE